MATKVRERESDILRTILDGLSAMKIWHMRCNTGGMYGSHKGKRWAVKFGRKGMADILAIPCNWKGIGFWPSWIEVKTDAGKQSPEQIAFQAEVEAEGHRYLVVRSWEEAIEAIRG